MPSKINEDCNWLGPDIQGSGRWVYHLTAADIAEINTALQYGKERGLGLGNLDKESFPLPSFGARIHTMLDEIETGLGMYLLRGFPSMDYGKDDLRHICWGIGLHCGEAVSQSKRGDVLGDVRDIGTPADGPNFRGYTSSGELTYHSDAADVTALFCLRAAKQGGLSRIVSLPAIHDEILHSHPDLLEALYQPCHWGRQGNERPGQSPYYTQPIFDTANGLFAGRYTRTHIRTAELSGSAPPPSKDQLEAFRLVDEIADSPEFHVSMMFEPGDMQFLNNHLTLHTRTALTDFGDADLKRHLLRLWFSPANSRALPASFKPFFGDISPGAKRGGFPGHGDGMVFKTS
jgi:hypothetical protein